MKRFLLPLACIGFLGAIVLGSLLPAGARLLPWYSPQSMHVLVYAGFAILVRATFRFGRRPVIRTVLIAGGAGLLLEFAQAFTPVREFSLQDAALNFLGALIGVVIFGGVARYWPWNGDDEPAEEEPPGLQQSTQVSRELSALSEDRLLAAWSLLLRQQHISQPLAGLARQVHRATKPLGNAPTGDAGVLSALEHAGVRTLLLKGTLLAHSVYDAPAQRERGDTDILVASKDRAAAEAALQRLGLARSWSVTAKTSDTQDQWQGRLDTVPVVIDLHWQLLNHPAFSDLFDFESLWMRRAVVEVGGVSAAGLGRVDALLHAALHYFAHHGDEFRPAQWLLDMDLLWRAMDGDEREQLVQLATKLGISGLVAEALWLTQERFGTPIAMEKLITLKQSGEHQWRTGLLKVGSGPMADQIFKLRAIRGWRARLAHVKALLFPSWDYMRTKYPGASRWALPWLYVKRMVGGGKG